MTTPRTSASPVLPRLLYEEDVNERAPVVLVDVGCSGGVEPHWFHFGRALRVVGFDPLLSEVRHLNAEARDGVHYEAAFVGCKTFEDLFPKRIRIDAIATRSNASFQRTSAAAYVELKKLDYTKENFNRGMELVYSDRRVQLDDFVAETGIKQIDFLKIDTDGADIEVLLGARGIVAAGCLAISVESQFHGPIHRYANTFCNIDALLRDLGFTLFDLAPQYYTRAALPGAFCSDIPAQTVGGSVQWAEAVYARDFADADYERKHALSPTGEDVLKLATFFDMFGLQDCAVELLLARRDLVEPLVDLEPILNALTPDTLGAGLTYAQYTAAFRKNPTALLAGYTAAEPGTKARIRPIEGLFSLTRRQVYQATLEDCGPRLRVSTAPERWCYAVGFPKLGSMTGHCLVLIDVLVEEGCVGVGALTSDGSTYLQEQQVTPEHGPVTIEFPPRDVAACASLMIRNVRLGGQPSRVLIESIRIYDGVPLSGRPKRVIR